MTSFRQLMKAVLPALLWSCGSMEADVMDPATSYTPVQLPDPPALTAPAAPMSLPAAAASGPCVHAGCSGEICVERGHEPGTTVCTYKPEDRCLSRALCEWQESAQRCVLAPTAEMNACLAALGHVDR